MKTSGPNAQDESFRIWGGESIVYTSPPFASSSSITLDQCLPATTNNQYRIQMMDSRGDSWSYTSTLQVEGVYGNIVFKHYMSSLLEEFFTLSLYNPITTNSEWKFSQTYANNWNNVPFDDAQWASLAMNGEISAPSATQYYRMAFAGIGDMAAYEVRFNYKYGIVAYINGVEIYRDNMLPGAVTEQSTANGAYESYAFRGVLRSAVEISTASVLSVEIHMQPDSTESSRSFDAWLSMYAPMDNGECFVVPFPVSVSSPGPISVPSNAFDFDLGSVVSSQSFPLTLDFTYSGSLTPVVNGIRVYTSSPSSAVQSFTFSGSNSASSYTPIVSASDLSLESPSHTSWSTYYQKSAWKYYRGEFSRSSGSLLYLYEVQPLVCNTPPLTQITFASSSYTAYVNRNYIQIRPQDSQVQNCTLNHDLPAGLEFASDSCLISGTPTSVFPNTTITMTSSLNGGISGSFSLQVITCPGKMIEILRTYKANAVSETFTIFDEETNQVLYSVGADNSNPDDQDVSTSLCMTTNRIGIEMGNTDSWSPSSYLYVKLWLDNQKKEILARARHDTGLNLPNYYVVSLNYPVLPGAEWLYKPSEVPANWYDASVVSGWNSYSAGSFPDSTNRIQLYKKTFTIESLTNVTAFSVNVQYRYGIIIMMNGYEVFRYGIEGDLSTNSQATTTSDGVYYHLLTLPIQTMVVDGEPQKNLLTVGSNTMAIALVSITESQVSSVFDCTVRLIDKEEHSRIWDYGVIAFSIIGTPTYPFDHNSGYTITNSGSFGNSLTLEFFNGRREWINTMVIMNDLDSNNYGVSSFVFEAKNPEDEDYVTLKTVSGLEWSFAGQSKEIMILNNKPYNQYRWRTIKGFGSNRWRISMLDLRIEQLNLDIPELSYPDPLTIYVNVEMAEVYPNSEYYSLFTVSPDLPEGILLDATTGMISGTARTANGGTFVISATKITGGTSQFTLHLTVGYCTGDQSLITMTVRTDFSPQEGSYSLYRGRDTSGEPVSSVDKFAQSSTLVYYDFCLPNDLYTMVLKDTWGDGWYAPAGAMFSVDIGAFRFEVDQMASASKSILFSSYLPFQDEFTNWKVQTGEVPEDWMARNYNDESWEQKKTGEIGTAPNVAVYLRHHFSVPSVSDYQVLNVLVKFAGGVVAYLNGHKVARFNLPSEFTASTPALSEHDPTKPTFFHVILNMVDISTTDNVIAFEIHRAEDVSSSVAVSFYATGVFGVNDCSIVRDSFISTNSTGFSSGSVENIFDLSPLTTSQLESAEVPSIMWEVENLEGSRFNSYGLLSGSTSSNWGFSLYGTIRSQLIKLHETISETTKSRVRSYYNVSAGLMEFSALRWQLDILPSAGTVPPLTEILIMYCKSSGDLCPGVDDFPTVAEGQISPSLCGTGMTGYSYRECSGGVLGEVKTDMCSYLVPENIRYKASHYEFVRDIPVATDAPTYTNIVTNWYLENNAVLPDGLMLDNSTGVISGTPRNVTELKTFTVIGQNPSGVSSVEVSISVRIGECLADGVWPKTPVDSIAVYDCKVQGSYFGTQKRICVLGKQDGEWREVSGVCISYLIIIVVVVVVVIILVVLVLLLVKIIKRKKAVKGVKGAAKEKAAKKSKI